MVDIDSKQRDFDIFFDLFLRATVNIGEHYFQLPVAEREDPVYRERVYCYELYHRVREQMPDDYPYRLDGELDKMGHPLIQNSVGGVKPDFLVHERGVMNKNLVIIEVKPINVVRDGIKKDMETLCGFLAKAQYFRAIYLIYGDNGKPLDGLLGIVKEYMTDIPKESLFYFVQHKRSGTPAEIIWANR
jgi:hypothetical protein